MDLSGTPCSGKCNRYTCARSCSSSSGGLDSPATRGKHFHDEACSLQLRNLFADCPSLIFRKMSQRLLDRLRAWPNVQLVLGEFSRHTRHVFWRPCEDVPILTEKLDELGFLFVAKSSSDNNELG